MRRLIGLGVGWVIAAALAGCGSTTSGLGIGDYLLRVGEEPGYTLQGKPSVFRTAMGYAAGGPNAAAEAKHLNTAGFKQAAVQQLNALDSGGISIVLVLGSASAAKREQTQELASDIAEQGTVKVDRFALAQIPTSTGFEVPDGVAGAANVLFREGHCVLLVGGETQAGPPSGPAYHASVIAAARALYARTNGRPGVCAG